LVFGSDMPAAEQDDPIAGIDGAVARRTRSGAPFQVEQALDAASALRAFTSAPGEAVGARVGRLEPGYAADLLLLARDPRDGARSLADDPVVAMWIDGAPVTL